MVDAELARSLFSRARDRYESAGRIVFLAVFGLLIFHLTTFQPFIDATTRLDEAINKSEKLNDLHEQITQIQTQLKNLQINLHAHLQSIIDQTLEKKVADFQELNRKITRIRNENEDESAVSGGDPMMQMNAPVMQMQLQRSLPVAPRLPDFENSVTEKIKSIQDIYSLRETILPYVRKNIIDVRFAELNEGLQTIGSDLKNNAFAIADSAEQLAKNYPDYVSHFQILSKNLHLFIDEFAQVKIVPPEDNDWWTTVQGKMQTLNTLGTGVETSLSRYLNREVSERLGNELTVAIQQQETLKIALDKEIDTLEKQFESQQEQMQGLGDFAKWGVLSLKPVAAKFPLLLAIVLAAVSLMLSSRIQELSLAIRTLPDTDSGVYEWFQKRISDSRDLLVFNGLPVREIVRAVAAILWLALASWQVSRWEEVGTSAWLQFVLGFGILSFAAWYRWQVLRKIEEQVPAEG